jgi:hypothetical protein
MNTTPTSTTEFLDLPDGLAYDDTGDGTLVLRHEFQPTGVYLDSATYGPPPKVALQGLSAVTAAYTRKARTGLAARRGAFEHESESAPGRSLAWGQALGRRRGRGPLRDLQSGLANAHGRNFKSDRLRDVNSTPPRIAGRLLLARGDSQKGASAAPPCGEWSQGRARSAVKRGRFFQRRDGHRGSGRPSLLSACEASMCRRPDVSLVWMRAHQHSYI